MQRDLSLDLARGFTVLFMPVIHTVLVFSRPEIHESWLGIPLTFIAEGPGAQLFMLIMGMGLVFKKPALRQMAVRSVSLLITGFVLNYLKFGITFQASLLPEPVVRELQVENIVQIIAIGDILHFAAIAMPLCWFIRQMKNYWWWATGFAVIVIFIAPCLWDIKTNYCWQLAGGQPPQIFFPLFPWLVYPLIGLTVGHFWKMNPDLTANLCGWTGVFMIIAGISWGFMFDESPKTGFYRTHPGETVWHTGVVLLALHAWKQIEKVIDAGKWLPKLLCFYSRQISVVYIVQWLLICWLIPFAGYQSLDMPKTLIMIWYISAFTLLITITIQKFIRGVRNRSI